MNPAALKANIGDLPRGSTIIADADEFTKRNLAKVGYDANPLEDGSLADYQLHALDLTGLAVAAVAPFGLGRKDSARTKNMFALGLLTWLFTRPVEHTLEFLDQQVRRQAADPRLQHQAAFLDRVRLRRDHRGVRGPLSRCRRPVPPGTYRQITGNKALALGLMAGAAKANLPLFLGAYPITPGLRRAARAEQAKDQGVTTFQAEDEIAAVGAALGASYAGHLGVTSTSGPGMALKSRDHRAWP